MAHTGLAHNFPLDFSWIRPGKSMHSFRLRYVVLGLLIYIQNAFCRTCMSEFSDVPSRAFDASIIFEGTVEGKSGNGHSHSRYNASFSVRKVLKGYLPQRRSQYLPVVVGEFGPENLKKCITEVNVDDNYVVFLRVREDPAEPFYWLSAVPEPSSKKTLRDVRKHICNKCVKAPKAKLVPQDLQVTEGRRIQLRCKTGGRPTPTVTWLRNDRPLKETNTVKITHGKRSSRLRIRKSRRREDSGVYTCVARSVVGTTQSTTMVSVMQERDELPKGHEEWVLCEQQSYCLNGGTCYKLTDLGTKFCRCPQEYVGTRCQSKDIFTILTELETRQAHTFDRNMTITGLVLGALVFLAILLTSYCLSRRRRIKYEQKMAEKKRLQLRVNGLPCGPLLDGGGTNGPVATEILTQASIKPPQVERQDSSTQTDPSCPPSASNPPATSSDRPPPPYYTTVAIVESDPDRNSHQSSPSQTSKTESSHGDRPVVVIAPTSKTSLDFDQHSDYDNNLSDGANNNGNGGGGAKSRCSSDSDSDTSSIGEEQALFLSLKNQKPLHPIISSDGDLTAWHEFMPSTPPPPPTSPYSNDHYAFNPYAIDDDIIHNPGGRHVVSQLVDGIMYDPDPDATPV